jgi:flagellar assembly factor FliW
MSHKVEVLLYLNVAKTIRSSIELIEICETEADSFTVSTPYDLRTEWRTMISQRVIEDILYDHRALVAITDILLVQEKNRILRHDGTGDQDNYNR